MHAQLNCRKLTLGSLKKLETLNVEHNSLTSLLESLVNIKVLKKIILAHIVFRSLHLTINIIITSVGNCGSNCSQFDHLFTAIISPTSKKVVVPEYVNH